MAVRDIAGGRVADAVTVHQLMLDKLATSGITEDDANKLKLTALTNSDLVARNLWRGGPTPPPVAFGIPYFDPWTGAPFCDGGHTTFRARCLNNPLPKFKIDKDGKERKFPKYTQAWKSKPHVYFAPHFIDWKTVLADPTIPILITEGELKAIAGCKNGYATIGLGGVWLFQSEKSYATKMIPELERVVWDGRIVQIGFDSDIASKPGVEKAFRALSTLLIIRGARVFKLKFPPIPETDKTGLDDFIVFKGLDAFKELLESAEELENWRALLDFDTNNKPISNIYNAYISLSHAFEFENVFGFDQMMSGVAVVSALPGSKAAEFKRRARTESDVFDVRFWMQGTVGMSKISKEDVGSSIDRYAETRPFHPIREHLRSVVWDGKPRLNGWLHTYLGAPKSEYTEAVSSMFLISMVARVEDPGCKVDHALVLIGDQGMVKSTVCRILAGDEWFSDNLPKLDNADEKRVAQHMRGKWLIEIGEFSAMRRAGIEEVKQFVSKQVEKFIPMYGRYESVEPRQCVFVVTTNERLPLKDDTGNRRWWPVDASYADLANLRKDRDQLFAEAFARYQQGEKWWPERVIEERLFKPEQASRTAGGEWDDLIDEALMKDLDLVALRDRKALTDYGVNTNYIAINILDYEKKHITSEVARRIASSLRRLGWLDAKLHGKRKFSPSPELIDKVLKGLDKKAKVIPIRQKGKY